MVTKKDVLKVLSEQRDEKGQLTTILTGPLAKKVGTTEGSLRSQLSSLKREGYVEGSTPEGWIITQDGIDALEREEEIPTTPQDVGSDPRSKLKYYGQLAGVSTDIILATIELIISGDAENLEQVWNAMTEMNVELTARRRWFNLWRNYLKQAIPPSLKEKVAGTSQEPKEGKEGEVAVSTKDKGRDYIIVDDLPVFVGAGSGDYSLADAKDILGIRTIKARLGGGGGGGGGGVAQQWSLQDIIALIDKITEKQGSPAAPKTYAVQMTDQGVLLKEVQLGEPVVLGAPGGTKSPKTILVNPDGTTQEVEAGHPVVIKQVAASSAPPKVMLVRQTDKGIVMDEFDASKPIILNAQAGGGAGMPMLPFPVFGNDGKPVLDSEGRPVYANLEPSLRWLGFQSEQRRADERHTMLMKLGETVRENVGDGIAALKAAVEEARKETQGKGTGTKAAPAAAKCGNCRTMFAIPTVPFDKVECPSCHTQYSREEVLAP